MAVFTPTDKGPSQPDLTHDARKMALSEPISGNRLPSPILRPSKLYQKVREGEQPVALSEKGRPTQAFTILTACDGAAGSEVTLSDTSLEAITQVPAGRVEYRANDFIFAPFSVGVAIIESTAWPLSVQV